MMQGNPVTVMIEIMFLRLMAQTDIDYPDIWIFQFHRQGFTPFDTELRGCFSASKKLIAVTSSK